MGGKRAGVLQYVYVAVQPEYPPRWPRRAVERPRLRVAHHGRASALATALRRRLPKVTGTAIVDPRSQT